MSLHTLLIGLLLCTILFRKKFIPLSQTLDSGSGTDTVSGTTPISAQSGASNQNKISLISIDINCFNESHEFNIRELSKSKAFTVNEGFGFNIITCKGVKIWRAECDEKYSTAIVLEDKKILKIKLVGGTDKIIKKDDLWLDEELFDKVDNSKKTPFVLFLDKQSSTEKYDFTSSQDGKIKTYTAKDTHIINNVKLLESILHVGRADRYIFNVSNHKFYATKVVLSDLGSYKLKVDIDLSNILRLTYYRSAWGSKWSYKGFIVFSHLKPIFLDINKKESNEEFEYKKEGKSEIFTPKQGYLFESVNAIGSGCKNNSYIWTSDNDKSYSNKVEVCGTIIYIYQKNGIKKTFKTVSEGCCSLDCFFSLGIHLCTKADKYVEDSSVAITNEKTSAGSKPSEGSGSQVSNPTSANETSNSCVTGKSTGQTSGGDGQTTT